MALSLDTLKHFIRRHTKFSAIVFLLLIITVALYSYVQFMLLFWSFMTGIVISYSFLSPDSCAPNLLFLYTRKKKDRGVQDELNLMKVVCPICGQRKCPRHRPELNILAFQPWTNLEVPEKVDQAVEEFLNIVLKEFVHTWYKNLSLDEEFLDELKTSLRFLAAVLLRRAQKIDVPTLVTDKLVKAAIQHLDCYLHATDKVPAGTDHQQATLDYIGADLHCAMTNRKAELEYIRRLVESLFPYIMQPQAQQSKSMLALVREIFAGSILMPVMDALANPDMINNLLLIFLDPAVPPVSMEPPSDKVQFLANYAQPLSRNKSCMRLDLAEMMSRSNASLLYPFMQFLKSEAAVNVLQFCLACDDFNSRILNPDLSEAELAELHNMAKDLYKSYIAPNAVDKIKLEEDIVTEMREIVDGEPSQVVRLRTSTPLFKAYEYSYNLLENAFLPLFHQSDDYYTMLCGSRVTSQISRVGSKQTKKKEFGFSNIGTKLKEVFRSNTLDGKSGPEVESSDEADTVTIASTDSVEDEVPSSMIDGTFQEFPLRDLSTWRVTIPNIGARPDPDNIKKQFFNFSIDVRRVDVSDDDEYRKGNWCVARRYEEFYVLQQKLIEFHGDFDDCQLPPKKSFGTRNQEFTQGKMDIFEKYLQKLLTMPHLKGSELLYHFLTSEDELTTGFLPDINIGKMFKSVPLKLVKERGQHLDPFLQSFLSSTEVPKPKPSKMERRDSNASAISSSSEKLSSGIFENNANITSSYKKKEQDAFMISEVNGAFDSLVYVVCYVYNSPQWFHKVLMTARMLIKNTMEGYLDWYIGQKLDQVTQEHRVTALIHLLRGEDTTAIDFRCGLISKKATVATILNLLGDTYAVTNVLFFDTDPPRTDEQKSQRLEQTLHDIQEFIPKSFGIAVGEQQFHEGTKLILNVLQQPKLNKQLTYVFLDIVMLELFPELQDGPISPIRTVLSAS